MDVWGDLWACIAVAEAEAESDRERRMSAMAPQLPPAGARRGKTIIPRIRANLPDGMRNRFGRAIEKTD